MCLRVKRVATHRNPTGREIGRHTYRETRRDVDWSQDQKLRSTGGAGNLAWTAPSTYFCFCKNKCWVQRDNQQGSCLVTGYLVTGFWLKIAMQFLLVTSLLVTSYQISPSETTRRAPALN